jgi:1-acyl-sn-glycerol-3-phosphate acyltransferase
MYLCMDMDIRSWAWAWTYTWTWKNFVSVLFIAFIKVTVYSKENLSHSLKFNATIKSRDIVLKKHHFSINKKAIFSWL